MSKQFVRSAKNVMKGYSSAQVLVRDATSNDLRPTNIRMLEEIATRTYDSVELFDIMEMLDKRLNDKGKYWKHIVKSLTLLDYLVRFGSENCVLWSKENLYIIKTLREFRYEDESGIDQGQIIRVKAKELTGLLMDDERLKEERRFNNRKGKARQNSNRPASNRNRSRSNGWGRDLNNDPPHSSYVDHDLQKAIEESKRTVEEDENRRLQLAEYDDEDPEFQAALQLSKEEEELKDLQDLQRLQQQQQQQQQYQFQQQPIQTGAIPQNPNVYYDIFGNPISADEYNEYQDQQNQWEEQQEKQRIAQEQYLAQQQQQLALQQQQQALELQQQQQHAAMIAQQQHHQQAAFQQPMSTGSNNPFAMNSQPQAVNQYNKVPDMPIQQAPVQAPAPAPAQASVPVAQPQQPLKQMRTGNEEITNKFSELNGLLANGTGIDTFGNTGEQRIPAQHTATGTFINSQGTGYHQESNAPKNNPFLNKQYTGLPSASIIPAQTGFGFGNQGPQQQQQQQDNQLTQPQVQHNVNPVQNQYSQSNQYNQLPQQQTQQQYQYNQQTQQQQQQQQQQNAYPQPPQFQNQNQNQNQYQQQSNIAAPDQGINLIDL